MNVGKKIKVELEGDYALVNYISFFENNITLLSSDEMFVFVYLYECAKYKEYFNVDILYENANWDEEKLIISFMNLQMSTLIDITKDDGVVDTVIIKNNFNEDIKTAHFKEMDTIIDNPFYKVLEKINIQNSKKEIAMIAKAAEDANLNKADFDKNIFNALDHDSNKVDVKTFLKHSIKTKGRVSNFDELLDHFEKHPSDVFLQRISNGRKLNKSEIYLIKTLREQYLLPDSVINVMLEYVIRINDGNLNKGLVESVASTWSRKNIKSAQAAIDFAKKYKKKQTKSIKANISPSWLEGNVEESDTTIDVDLYDKFKEF